MCGVEGQTPGSGWVTENRELLFWPYKFIQFMTWSNFPNSSQWHTGDSFSVGPYRAIQLRPERKKIHAT